MRLYDPLGPSVGPSVTLFLPIDVILGHLKLFKVIISQFTFSLLVFWSFSLLVLWSLQPHATVRCWPCFQCIMDADDDRITNHEEVLETSRVRGKDLQKFVEEIVAQLDQSAKANELAQLDQSCGCKRK